MTRTFSIDTDAKNARHGWMHCWLVVDGQRHHLDASSVFPPFRDLLLFARALAANQLPHEFFWDEEGHGAKFQALPSPTDNSRFQLLIEHDGTLIMDTEFDRRQIMHGLLETLRQVSLDCPGAESEWEFPYFLITDFEEALTQGHLDAPNQRARFVFSHFSGYGGMERPAFAIWVGHIAVFFMDMQDSDYHWQSWFTLLEKLKAGELPYEYVVKQNSGEGSENQIFLFLNPDSTSFRLEPVSEEHLFRLIITGTFREMMQMKESELVNFVLDRQQFVASFAQTFQEFLETDYLAFLNSGECDFDLRSLPLDRLYR